MDVDRNGNYEKELNCQWLFTGQDGKNLRLSFTSFNVESAANDTYQNCFDYVEVRFQLSNKPGHTEGGGWGGTVVSIPKSCAKSKYGIQTLHKAVWYQNNAFLEK